MKVENKKEKMEWFIENKINIPKFQRSRKWKDVDDGSRHRQANCRDYIDFLMRNKNSVFPISLGVYFENNSIVYNVIDGNNRIYAISTFMTKPYIYYADKYEKLLKYIDKCNFGPNGTKLKEIVINLSYKNIMNLMPLTIFNDNNLILPNYDTYAKELTDEFNDFVMSFKTNKKEDYNSIIEININLFTGGTFDDFSKIFEDINKSTNILTDNELLASMLYSKNMCLDDLTNDAILTNEIMNQINVYYNEKNKQNVESEYRGIYKFNTNEINAYDVMIGFQNHCNDKYKFVELAENNKSSSSLSMFFKLFRTINDKNIHNKKLHMEHFTTENMKYFINIVNKACNNIYKCYMHLCEFKMHKEIEIKTFDIDNACTYALIVYNMYAINNEITTHAEKINKRYILYNMFCKKDLFHDNVFETYNKKNIFKTSRSQQIETNVSNIYSGNLKEFKNPLNPLIDEADETNDRANFVNMLCDIMNKRSENKNKSFNYFDKILLNNYWIHCMSLTCKIDMKPLTPFSSKCDGNIYRLGNFIPCPNDVHKWRKNGNLDILKKQTNNELWTKIKDFLPHDFEYKDVNKYDSSKNINTIISIDKYNNYCTENEQKYIKYLVDTLY